MLLLRILIYMFKAKILRISIFHILISLFMVFETDGQKSQSSEWTPEMVNTINAAVNFDRPVSFSILGQNKSSSEKTDYYIGFQGYRTYSNVDSIISENYFFDYTSERSGTNFHSTELGNFHFLFDVDLRSIEYNIVFIFYNNENNMPDSVTCQLASCDSLSPLLASIKYEYDEHTNLVRQNAEEELFYIKGISSGDKVCYDFKNDFESDGSKNFDTIFFINDSSGLVEKSFSNSRTIDGEWGEYTSEGPKVYYSYSHDSLLNQYTRIDSIFKLNYGDTVSIRYQNVLTMNSTQRVIKNCRSVYDSVTKEWYPHYLAEYTYTSDDTLNFEKIVSLFVEEKWVEVEKVVSEYSGTNEWVKKYFVKYGGEWTNNQTSIFYLTNPISSANNQRVLKGTQNMEISLYPNPCSSGMLGVKCPYNERIQRFSVFSLTGKLLIDRECRQSGNEIEVNVGSLPPGFYILNCQMNNGRYISSKFLINK